MAEVLALPNRAEPAKKVRERIQLIETPPRAGWFVRHRERGRTVWYLRFQVTGMLPRRFGPFATRHRALLALDAMIDHFNSIDNELNEEANKRRLQHRFQFTGGFIVEDALALKGR